MSDQSYYQRKLKKAITGRIAVYIDTANLEKSAQDLWVHPKDLPDSYRGTDPGGLAWRINYKKLKKFFYGLGPLAGISFYTAAFGTENHIRFLETLGVYGYRIIKKPLKLYADHTDDRPHRKANFDVEISVDAVAHLDQYDTMILISGDSDFVYLLNYLREHGKRVVLFSHKGHVAKELFAATDQYFDIIDFRHEILRIMLKKSQESRT